MYPKWYPSRVTTIQRQKDSNIINGKKKCDFFNTSRIELLPVTMSINGEKYFEMQLQELNTFLISVIV